jgi:hypothetical protein
MKVVGLQAKNMFVNVKSTLKVCFVRLVLQLQTNVSVIGWDMKDLTDIKFTHLIKYNMEMVLVENGV